MERIWVYSQSGKKVLRYFCTDEYQTKKRRLYEIIKRIKSILKIK